MAIDLQTAHSAIEAATHLKQQFATRAAHHAELLRRIAGQQAPFINSQSFLATGKTMTTAPNRAPDSSVLPVILNRWSPRAFLPETIGKEELLALIDAGRWAPSAYNMQPWRFIYARRGTSEWERFLSWLIPFNQSWAENASAIIYVASQTITLSSRTGEPTPLPTHAFDAGAAAVLIQIQAAHNGWATHPVSGFDHTLAHAGLELPEEYELHVAIILGRQGKVETLPESLQKREIPSDRNALNTLSFEGRWYSSKESETDN